MIVADLAGATGHPWYALVTLGAVVLAFAYRSPLPAAAGVTAVAWALHTGFVLGRLGELTFDAQAALAALVLASALVTGALARAAVSTAQSRVSTLQTRVSSIPARVSSVPVRESSVRVREFAGRVLRVP
ncbi:hypothetical protein [Amycolatopsis tolypomycina]|uniref:hypothetical protein n=1 Tax=Amycolatopsis tolypomycina TaxID=208445 RepID=UPI001FC93748|nr:hypothetical protein [Amycolatopsis tolypomycina]